MAMHNGSLPGCQRGNRLRLITVKCRRRLRIQSETKANLEANREVVKGGWRGSVRVRMCASVCVSVCVQESGQGLKTML